MMPVSDLHGHNIFSSELSETKIYNKYYFFTAKGFIGHLMEKDVKLRYKCKVALQHPW